MNDQKPTFESDLYKVQQELALRLINWKPKDFVTVTRIVTYRGPAIKVWEQVNRSLHGTRVFSSSPDGNVVSISAQTVGFESASQNDGQVIVLRNKDGYLSFLKSKSWSDKTGDTIESTPDLSQAALFTNSSVYYIYESLLSIVRLKFPDARFVLMSDLLSKTTLTVPVSVLKGVIR